MGPLIVNLRGKVSRPSVTPYDNERNGTAPSTLRGERFRRIDEIDSTASSIRRPITADVHDYAHPSPTVAADEFEMNGITTTKTGSEVIT